MASRVDETQRRLLTAAAAEFSKYGIAGARVERISTTAGVNNALLYRYFGSKVQLFHAVFNALVVDTLNDVPIDSDDLAGYAGRLFDSYGKHPDVVRLSTWYALENGGDLLPPYVKETHLHKMAAIKTAQRNGVVNASIDAAALLNLILHMCLTGSLDSPVMKPVGISRAARRRAVVEAVTRIVQP